MKKVKFGSVQLTIFLGLLIVSFSVVSFCILDKQILGWKLIPQEYQLAGWVVFIISLILTLLRYNFIEYNHDHLIIKINRFYSKKLSFKFIKDYKIEDKQLLIYSRDNSQHKFSLNSMKPKDIERLDHIIDIHIHEFL